VGFLRRAAPSLLFTLSSGLALLSRDLRGRDPLTCGRARSTASRANCDQLPFAFRDGFPILVLLGDGIYLAGATLHMTFHDYC
jgi:hypothetical protein